METLYTLAEAAAALRVSVETLRRELRRQGLIPRRVGRQILLTDADLRALALARAREGEAARQPAPVADAANTAAW